MAILFFAIKINLKALLELPVINKFLRVKIYILTNHVDTVQTFIQGVAEQFFLIKYMKFC